MSYFGPSHVLAPLWRVMLTVIGVLSRISRTRTLTYHLAGNTYSIKNVGSGTARIFFAQACEVVARGDE